MASSITGVPGEYSEITVITSCCSSVVWVMFPWGYCTWKCMSVCSGTFSLFFHLCKSRNFSFKDGFAQRGARVAKNPHSNTEAQSENFEVTLYSKSLRNQFIELLTASLHSPHQPWVCVPFELYKTWISLGDVAHWFSEEAPWGQWWWRPYKCWLNITFDWAKRRKWWSLMMPHCSW